MVLLCVLARDLGKAKTWWRTSRYPVSSSDGWIDSNRFKQETHTTHTLFLFLFFCSSRDIHRLDRGEIRQAHPYVLFLTTTGVHTPRRSPLRMLAGLLLSLGLMGEAVSATSQDKAMRETRMDLSEGRVLTKHPPVTYLTPGCRTGSKMMKKHVGLCARDSIEMNIDGQLGFLLDDKPWPVLSGAQPQPASLHARHNGH